MIRALHIILVIFLGINCFSQKNDCSLVIEGQIKSINKEEFQFLKVTLINPFNTQKINSNGSFKIKNACKGQNIIELRYLGSILKKDTIDIQNDTLINYNLESHVFQLPLIEIKTNKLIENSFEKEELDEKELSKTKGETLGEILENINGVNTLKTGNSISKPIIQGLHSNRILILNNEIRQEGQQWGAEHAPEIDPNMANSISVIKGANSIKYGFDAIGGVILIEPQKTSDSINTEAELNLAGFSNGRQGFISGLVTSRLKKLPSLSYGLQGSLKRGGNYHTPNYFLKNTGIKEYNFSSIMNYDFENFGINFYYSQFNTDLGIFSGSHIGNLTDLQFAFEQNEPIEQSGFSYEISRPFQHIEHELTKGSVYINFDKIGKLELVYGRQYNLRYEFDKHKSLIDSIEALNQPDLQLELTSHTLDLKLKHNTIKNISGEIGINALTQRNTYTGRMFIPNYRNKGIGAYIVEKSTFDKLTIEAGARYDFRELQSFFWENNEIVSPINKYQNSALNLGAKYNISNDYSISYNISKTWRPPSVNELYSDGLHHGAASVEIGNENLEPENSINSNLDFKIDKKKFGFELNPYLNYFNNYIFMEPQLPPTLTIKGAFPTFVFKQTEAIITGFDASTQVNIAKGLWLHSSASIVRGYNRSISDYLVFMPSDRLKNKVIYQLKDYKKLTKNEFSITHNYVDKQTRVPVNSDFALAPAAYHLFDLLATTTLKLKTETSISFGINNILNTSYRDYLNRFRYYADEIGRNYTIRIKINFN